jgi:hypothetical protein
MIMAVIKITSENNKKVLRRTIVTEKLIAAQMNKDFPAFHGTQEFVTMFIRYRHCDGSYPKSEELPHPRNIIV